MDLENRIKEQLENNEAINETVAKYLVESGLDEGVLIKYKDEIDFEEVISMVNEYFNVNEFERDTKKMSDLMSFVDNSEEYNGKTPPEEINNYIVGTEFVEEIEEFVEKSRS